MKNINKKFFLGKIIALLLSLVMVFGCLTGCANSVKKQTENIESETAQTGNVVSSQTYTASELPDVVRTLDFGEGIEVSDVKAVYISEEYYEETYYNSLGNYFIGYSAEELLALDGEACFFSVSDDGSVTIETVNRGDMLKDYEASLLPPKQNNVLRNFLIGGGVILVTATLSVFGSPAVACVAFSAFKGACLGATVGAAVYATGSAISYRISEGTWKGAGDEILESASKGFMVGAVTGAISGALGANNCFVAGTPVCLAGGSSMAIENLSVGAEVVCLSEDNPYDLTSSVVVDTFSREVETTYIVNCGNFNVETTAEHPFYVVENGWTEAQYLESGDHLITQTVKTLIVDNVTVKHEPSIVYNFEVKDYHTYYVGGIDEDEFVLVHNSCAHTQKEWANERTSYWKKNGNFYKENYSTYKNQLSKSGKYIVNESNVQRMLAGKAPLDAVGKSVQLHHAKGITTDMYSYIELTRAEHYANFRALHYWLYN